MFNNIINFLLFVSVAVLAVMACTDYHKTAGGEIEALYWHEGERYTAVTKNADLIEHHDIPPYYDASGTVKVYTDLKPDEKSWYKCEWDFNAFFGTDNETSYCEVHIHSLDDLGTADWNHGKFGSGSTTRIE